MTKLLLLSLLALNPEVMGPPRNKAPAGVTATGACATQITGDVICYDNNGEQGGQLTGTTDPAGSISRPQVCAPGDASCAASSKFFCPGQDTTTIAIDGADPSVTCAGDNDTVTVVVYMVTSNAYTATSTVLAEGTNWTASASVANTSTSLAAAVDALAGVSATSTSPNTLISLDTLTCYVTLAESTVGCTTVSTGDYGPAIRVPLDNDPVTPTIAFGDGDSGIYENTDDTLNMSIAGTRTWFFSASALGWATATGPALLPEVASVTNPTVNASWGDPDTGLGGDNANGCTLVSGGTEMWTCDADVFDCKAKGAYGVQVPGSSTHGAGMRLKTQEGTCTFAANPGAASCTTGSIVVPDGAAVKGVTTRVITAATNCTSVSIGDGTDVDAYGATTGITQNTTTTNANATAAFPNPALASYQIVITANGGNCFDGVWRVNVGYLEMDADSSN